MLKAGSVVERLMGLNHVSAKTNAGFITDLIFSKIEELKVESKMIA